MPTPLIIALGAIAWPGLSLALGIVAGRAFRLGDEVNAEVHREFSKGGEDWC